MAAASPRVAVVGAGIVGTAIAHALRKRGAEVVLVDRDAPGSGCSFGNSGAISPGSVAPLAMPGVLASVPSMLVDAESPLHVPMHHAARAAPWLLRFVAAARPAAVARSVARLAALHAGAIDAHEAMARELGVPELFLRRGHLHLYPDAAALAKDDGGWRLRAEHGYASERLDRAGILALEPRVAARYTVGMLLADHATILNPHRYVQAMAAAFAANGGRVLRAGVRAVRPASGRWRLDLEGGTGETDTTARGDGDGQGGGAFDHAVIAAGAWSNRLLGPLGIPVPLESQRGYHLQFDGGRDVVSRTVILADRKVFVTPMEDGLRVGGTVEIGGLVAPPDPRRSALLDRFARESFSGLDGLTSRTWMGHRPCMPDSVPIVGPAPRHPGLWLAVGHGHLGLTDSLPTAGLIADGILSPRRTELAA